MSPLLGTSQANPRLLQGRQVDARTVRAAAGPGARFRLTDDGLAMRLDRGVGSEGANVYFNLDEAFSARTPAPRARHLRTSGVVD